VAWIRVHCLQRDLAKILFGIAARQLARDRGQSPQRLAQRISRTRTHLQDREVIAHQRGEALRCLVVGRMRLEDELRIGGNEAAQHTCALRHIVDDLVMIELDAGLHDQCDHAWPCSFETRSRKCIAMCSNRRAGGLRRRDSQLVQLLGRTAGHWHFGADDIHGRLAAHLSPGTLGDSAQLRGALGKRRLWQGVCVVAARHRAVEMNLAKAGAHVFVDHLR
jgi:hypothetical protein